MEILPHTVKEWKTGGNFNLDDAKGLCKEMSAGGCCFFILFYFSAGAPKTPSSLNKTVQGISGKNVRSEKKKARKFES